MFSQGLSFHDGDNLVLHCIQSLTLLLKLSVPCGIAVFSQTVSGSHYLPDHSSGSVRGILSRDRIYEYVAHKLSLSTLPLLSQGSNRFYGNMAHWLRCSPVRLPAHCPQFSPLRHLACRKSALFKELAKFLPSYAHSGGIKSCPSKIIDEILKLGCAHCDGGPIMIKHSLPTRQQSGGEFHNRWILVKI